jgi:small subunit ribosomal protein S8
MGNMVSTDPIADILTRIRNTIAVSKRQIVLPHSNIKEKVAEVLVKDGFLSKVESNGEGGFKSLVVTINEEGTNPTITDIKRLSKPGRRLYAAAKEIPTVKYGRGVVIISTSKGIMTGTEAKQAGLGGELICQVY